jgi:DNA-binding NarL/FixJ family response regulator
MIRVLVADDQSLLRAGFRMIIDAQPDMRVVAEASDGADALEGVRRHRPEVVLMDIRMPVLDGIAATRRITATSDGPRVVILTTWDLDEYVFEALSAGASGFLLKDVPPEDLVRAIRVTAAGDALCAPSVTRKLIEAYTSGRTPTPGTVALDSLTEREREILELVARGLSNAEVGQRLHVGESTVKSHVGHILGKLELRDRVQAVILAYEAGLVRPGMREARG